MTRTPFDQFAKDYLEGFLEPLGKVETSREVMDEVRQVDVYFSPAPNIETSPQRQVLGLLGQMALSTCLFEPFRNQPSWAEVRNCLIKLFSIQADVLRQARREETSVVEDNLPRLWILAPSCSERLLEAFGAKLDAAGNWPVGIYFLPVGMRAALVAINQLPSTQETLLLRLLGKGETQRKAVDEVLALPVGHPLRADILEILASWRISLQLSQNLTDEQEEIAMKLSEAYLRWREETLEEGRIEGLQEGRVEGLQEGRIEGRVEGLQEERRATIVNLLRVKFGSLDEELLGIIEPLLQLSPAEYTPLLLNLSREELLAQFRS